MATPAIAESKADVFFDNSSPAFALASANPQVQIAIGNFEKSTEVVSFNDVSSSLQANVEAPMVIPTPVNDAFFKI